MISGSYCGASSPRVNHQKGGARMRSVLQSCRCTGSGGSLSHDLLPFAEDMGLWSQSEPVKIQSPFLPPVDLVSSSRTTLGL
jgi:hypothetical protein